MFDPTTLKPGDLLQYSGVNMAWPFTQEGKRRPLEECREKAVYSRKAFEPAIVLASDDGVVVFLEYYNNFEGPHWFKVVHPDHGVILFSLGRSEIQKFFCLVPTS